MSQAAATLFGPTAAGALRDQYGWKVTSLAMGIFSFSGAIPSVGSPIFLYLPEYELC
jgi:hypothetical protein